MTAVLATHKASDAVTMESNMGQDGEMGELRLAHTCFKD
jgi:hypothetical protein